MIVNHVSRVMGERRLSIAQTARAAGLAYTTVLDIYHDRVRRLDVDTLDALCKTLEVAAINDLFEYVPDERRAAQRGEGQD